MLFRAWGDWKLEFPNLKSPKRGGVVVLTEFVRDGQTKNVALQACNKVF